MYTEGADLPYTSTEDGHVLCFRADIYDNPAQYDGNAAEHPFTVAFGPIVAAGEVTAGSSANTFKATDNSDRPSLWEYVFISSGDTCGTATSFGSDSEIYTESSDVAYNHSHNGQKVCFRVRRGSDSDLPSSYFYASSSAIDVTGSNVAVTAGSALSTFKAVDNLDNTTDVTTWVYVFLDGSAPCDSTAFTGTPPTYTEGLDVPYSTANDGKKLCFRSTDGSSNSVYGGSRVITGPKIASVAIDTRWVLLAGAGKLLATKRTLTTIAVTFESPVTLSGAVRLELNTESGAQLRTQSAFGSGDTITFFYRPRTGEFTPGVDTADGADDEILRPTQLVLATGSRLRDAQGYSAVLETAQPLQRLADAVIDAAGQVAVHVPSIFVDGRVPTVTITNPTDLDMPTGTKTFSAVDDFDENNSPNFLFPGYDTHRFEYYFIPDTMVRDSDLAGELGERQLDYNCRFNDFYGESFPYGERHRYEEGTDLIVKDDRWEDHYICFRSRRQDVRLYWTFHGADIGGQVSEKITSITNRYITRIEDDASGVTSTDLGHGDSVNIRVYLSNSVTVDTTNGTPSLALSNGATVTDGQYMVSGTDYWLEFTYTVADVNEETTDLNVSAFALNGAVIPLNTDVLPAGDNLADNENINVVVTRPTITAVYAADGTVAGPHGETSAIEIVVVVSEELEVTTGGNAPRLTLNSGGNAAYDAYDSGTREITFTYTVASGHSARVLQVEEFQRRGYTFKNAASGAGLDFTLPNNLHNHATKGLAIEIDAVAHTVTVEPGGVPLSLRATDDDDDTDANEWHYVFIPGNACNAAAFTGTPDAYAEGRDVPYTSANDGERLCFRSVDDSASGNDNIRYARSVVLDGTPAVITVGPIRNYKVRASVDDSMSDFEYQVIYTNRDCDISLTSGFSAYPVEDTSQDPPRYEKIEIPNNGQKVCFRAFDGNNYAYAESAVLLDVTAPTIEITAGERNSVSAKIVDDDGTDDGINAHDSDPMRLFQRVTHAAFCRSSLTTVFSDYPNNSSINLDVGEVACFKAEDARGNVRYKASSAGTDITAPVVTVSQGTVAKTFTAVDNESRTTWHVVFVSSGCDNDDVFFTDDGNGNTVLATGAQTYSEGRNVSYGAAQNGLMACFRSADAAGNVSYGASTIVVLDLDAPFLRSVHTDSGRYYLGDSLQIFIDTSERVIVNGYPLLWLNSDEYAFASYNATDSTGTRLVFDYTVRSGHEAVSLDVERMTFTGSITDTSGNDLDATLPTLTFTVNGVTRTIILIGNALVDGIPPVITVTDGPVTNSLVAEVSEPDGTLVYAFIPSNGACNASTDFMSVTQGRERGYNSDYILYDSTNNFQRVCFRARDDYGFGNTTYETSRTLYVN